jgi:hypothetical protein
MGSIDGGQDHNGPRAADGQPVQFSLKTLFFVTTLAAISLSLLISIPDEFATPLLIVVAAGLPAVLTAAAVYGGPRLRAFSIGAVFPAGSLLLCTCVLLMVHAISAYQNSIDTLGEFFRRVGPYYRPFVGVTWVLCLVLGTLTAVVRWLVAPADGTRKHECDDQ